ncbi:hypothetical protein [Novosphingobium acidiphilum]|uniref:hypothetical protein n=1 Tax=Novosphingobium acidiphilum TaxID=505248 RepID=UPI0012EB66AD|nr:hypothetical protein [Novosphingobium acidiphilum]
MAEQDALAWLAGDSFTPDLLALDYGTSAGAWRRWPYTFVRVFERKIGGGERPSPANIANWINPRVQAKAPYPAPGDLPLALDMDRLKLVSAAVAKAAAQPPLLSAADIAAAFARMSPLEHSNVVIGTMLAERILIGHGHLSAGGIAAIGLKARQIPWRSLLAGCAGEEADDLSAAGDAARIRLAWLAALETGGLHVVKLAQAFHFWLTQLNEVCAELRNTSHLRAICLCTAKSHSLTAVQAAKEIGISRQAAAGLLEQACDARILREVTHGAAFRRYAADFLPFGN